MTNTPKVFPCDVLMPSIADEIVDLVRENLILVIIMLLLLLIAAVAITVHLVRRRKERKKTDTGAACNQEANDQWE